MEDTNRVYRIRTAIGEDAPNVIHVPLNQSYDMFEILSLKLDQTNTYKTYESDYGVIVGRVTANGGFGVPNAKVSVFIEVSDEETLKNRFLYNYSSTSDVDGDGVRYNLLPDFVDDACHQDVGTFPNKRLVLDNQDVIEIFDKYWKYTTTTNHAGDYMLYGIPTGSQQLHVDVDLSDCGILSQRPRDMIGKGYNANMFESPNKFKHSTNLNSLAQIISQDRGVYVYPYWGDVSDGDEKFSITRCDINLEYKFESYAVFIGSIVTDKGSNAIGKNCTGTENNGKMSDLIAGEGTIEMIRKTLDNKVEEFPIMGNRLIDGDGVWCYQIPMNLDYVTTDEFGNLVPTDNPDKGIATRTRVRFRISLDENPNDATARKRARYLVPNNPRMGEGEFDETLEADYEFGSATREESYCDMFWNKVYTVKNYIPKLQKNDKETNRKHTGIKLINHYGDNNPMPYNGLTIKLSFTYRIICTITKVIINLIEFVNEILSLIGAILCLLLLIIDIPMLLIEKIADLLSIKIFGKRIRLIPKAVIKAIRKLYDLVTSPITSVIWMFMPNCIGLSSEFCDDGINQVTYYPGCGKFFFNLFDYKDIKVLGHSFDCIWSGEKGTKSQHDKRQLDDCKKKNLTAEECALTLTEASNATAMLYNCIENQLAQQNDATSFNFYNDWINGVLYAPLWYRKITPKKSFFFGLFKRKAKDDWCSSQREYPGMRILQQCTTSREVDTKIGNNGKYLNFDGNETEFRRVINYRCDSKCHKTRVEVKGMNGVIHPKETMLGQTVYYYKAAEYDASLPHNPLYTGSKNGDIKLLFATDIILLGSLNNCDLNGVPQFFKTLESTTYDLPSDILFTDYDFILTVNENTGETERMKYTVTDLVKTSEMAGCDWGNPNEFDKYDGGLFYSIGCSSGSIRLDTKSCINLARICEYGVSLDETKEVADLEEINENLPEQEQLEVDAKYFQRLITDGFISWDELYNLDERSMFATMNGNQLKTVLNKQNGLREYDFRYLYPENFDGSLRDIMKKRTERYGDEINYKNNYKLEEASRDYYIFRMGNKPYYYDMNKENGYSFPRYENSYYFYFGLKAGKTAIEKFNSKYFAECFNPNLIESKIGIKIKSNSWCTKKNLNPDEREKGYSEANDGYLALDFSGISTPYNLLINGVTNTDYSIEINEITEEKIQFINSEPQEVPSNLLDGYVQVKANLINDVWVYSNDGIVIPMMNNGGYQGIITDSDGNISEFLFNISGTYLSFKLDSQDFEQPNNVLIDRFQTWDGISEHKGENGNIVTTDPKNVQRIDIGGVISIHDIFMDGENLDYYRLEITAKKGTPLDMENGYSGVFMIYDNGNITFSVGGNTLLNNENQNYAFGLPKGGCEYTITITELCEDGIDSDNTISKDITINEPIPYKMFINNIDYDIIKYFNHYTGWTTNSTVANHSVTEDTISAASNPWFNIENIYYNQNLLNDTDYTNNDIISFYVDKNNEDTSFTIKAVTEDGIEHDVLLPILLDEFTQNKVGQTDITVYYNWVNDYIVDGYEYVNWDDQNEAYNKIDNFIEGINVVFNKRKDLVSMMKDTFYISCEGQIKSFYITAQTNKPPYTQTIVYHPEKAVEFEEYNVLENDDLVDEDIDSITDIRIPTISYKSSIKYGDGEENNDSPCIAKVNDIKKKPYYVGVMNYAGVSIPNKNGESFEFIERDNAKYINHNNTQLNDLFNFPLIDKILILDYVAWSAFVNIPKYGYYTNEENETVPYKEEEAVTMNGLLAGVVYNGNVTDDKFDTQTLNSLDLKLSPNINANNPQTYVEKRIINGFNYEEIGNKIITLLEDYIEDYITIDIINKINEIFGLEDYPIIDTSIPDFEITEEIKEFLLNVISSLTVENNSIVYRDENNVIQWQQSIDAIIKYVLNFTNYIIDSNVEGTTQYAFLLPMQTLFLLQDQNGCGTQETLEGDLVVTLSNESVNNCKTKEKIVKFESDDSTYFSIFKINTDVYNYPLNKATNKNIFSWQITDGVNGIYDENNATQNLFSYQMKTDYLRGKNDLIDTDFVSEELISADDEEEEYATTRGYGTTGEFIYRPIYTSGDFDYPIFIVAETDNHVRALSPVYDYSYVEAIVKYGIYERKEVIEQVNPNTGVVSYTIGNTIEDYKFGIAYSNENNHHYYLDNYSYKLSGTCKIDSVNTIEVKEETLTEPNQFVFTSISQALYETLKSKFRGIIGQLLNDIVNNTTITAIDYTGLKHICGISSHGFKETRWYTYIWKGNLPLEEGQQPGIDTCGIRVNGEFLNETEFIYESQENPTIPQMYVSPNFDKVFEGWYDAETNTPIQDQLPSVTSSKVFYGKWNMNITHTVIFIDKNGQEIYNQTVQHMTSVTPPYDDSYWYKDGDSTKAEVQFPYTVTRDITFKELNVFTVRWCQQFLNVKFYDSDEETPISQDYEKQVEKGELVTPPTGCENYSWYVVGDVNKTEIDLNETPITQDMLFAKYPTYTVRWVENDEE